MDPHRGPAQMPAAAPVDIRDYDPGRNGPVPWYLDGDRWLRGGAIAVLGAVIVLEDLVPAALGATTVLAVAGVRVVNRGDAHWWVGVQLFGYVMIVLLVLWLDESSRSTGLELAGEIVGGMLVGAGLAQAADMVRRAADRRWATRVW